MPPADPNEFIHQFIQGIRAAKEIEREMERIPYNPFEELNYSSPTTQSRPPLFMPYETVEEAKLRLDGSIIRYRGNPVVVVGAGYSPGKKILLQFKANLDHPYSEAPYLPDTGWDLSPFPAKYFARNVYAAWCSRQPIRGVYRQGACVKNTKGRYAGTNDWFTLRTEELLAMYRKPNEVVPFQESTVGLSLRSSGSRVLSDKVAAFAFKSTNVGVEYRGLKVGTVTTESIKTGNIVLANHGKLTPWCIRALNEVGIQVRGN